MSAVKSPGKTPSEGTARRWVGRSPAPAPPAVYHRRRALALAVIGVVLALASAAFLVLDSSGPEPPATGAAQLVPSDALAYVHLSTDPSRSGVQDARRLASRFPDYPLLYAAVMSRVNGILGSGNVRPWLGKEAAVAVLAGAGSATATVLVLDVSNRARAQAFLSAAGAAPAGAYDGIRLRAYPSGSDAALVGHYLVAGPAAGVRAAIDAWRGRSQSLARNPAYKRAAASEPAGRVLDAYLPANGVQRLLVGRTGLTGAIGLLLDRPAVAGTAISLSAISGGAQVLIDSALSGGSRAASFTPTLQSVLPSGSTLMLDVHGLRGAAPELLSAGATAGIGANIAPFLGRLGTALASQGVNVGKVLSIFDGETAVALSPGPSPALLIVSRLSNVAAAQSELASLEAPLTALFSPSADSLGGQEPEIADTQVGGATVHEFQLGAGLQVDDAVFDGLAVVSTSIRAIEQVAQRSHALAGDASYRAVLPSGSGQVSSLVFGNVTRLLGLAEQTGLTAGARTRELLPDLARIRSIGLTSTSAKNDTTTKLTFEIP